MRPRRTADPEAPEPAALPEFSRVLGGNAHLRNLARREKKIERKTKE